MKFKQTNQICSPLKISKSKLNKAYAIEIAKACTVAFMKARNSLVVRCGEECVNWKKKTEHGKNLFFSTSANRFWLTLKYCSWLNEFAHGRPSIKWTSRKGNDTLLKVD